MQGTCMTFLYPANVMSVVTTVVRSHPFTLKMTEAFRLKNDGNYNNYIRYIIVFQELCLTQL